MIYIIIYNLYYDSVSFIKIIMYFWRLFIKKF